MLFRRITLRLDLQKNHCAEKSIYPGKCVLLAENQGVTEGSGSPGKILFASQIEDLCRGEYTPIFTKIGS
jgi:hypothetical protein